MDDKIQKFRKYLITINNPEKHNLTRDIIIDMLENKPYTYWCLSEEIGAQEQTPHIHVFIYHENQIKLKTIKNLFPKMHIDICNGTCQQNRDYVFKAGVYSGTEKETTNIKESHYEHGECPIEEQGQRNDLTNLYDFIKQGLSDFEILEKMPYSIRYIEKIDKVRQTIKYEEFRNKRRFLRVIYQWGKSGSGKTRSIMDTYGDDKVYRVTDYQHPFDEYRGEDVVLFEEFRSNFPISDMLNYLDIYPLHLGARYSNKCACYTKVYINSNIDLREQYQHIQLEQPESWNALIRRINYVSYYDGENVHQSKTEDYLQFKNISEGEQLKLPFD